MQRLYLYAVQRLYYYVWLVCFGRRFGSLLFIRLINGIRIDVEILLLCFLVLCVVMRAIGY